MKKLAILAALLSRPLVAGDCGDNCAIQREKTLVTEKLLQLPVCDRSALDTLESKSFPTADDGRLVEGTAFPTLFLLAVCNYHQEQQKSSLDAQEKIIDQLQKSATRGLMPAQKTAAAFYEGLAHCRAAQILHDQEPGDAARDWKDQRKSRRLKDLFCMHRSMAKEAFGEVNWTHFQLAYASSKSEHTLTRRIEEMASCGQNILQSSNDSYCGEITPLANEDIQAIATQAAGEIMNRYIGTVAPEQAYEPGAPPYSAMMTRKLLMTEGTLNKSKDNFTTLAQKNAMLQSSFEQLLGAYGSVSSEGILTPGGITSYPGRVSIMQEKYLDAVAKTQALLDLAERWEKGLFTGDGKHDMRVDLKKMREELKNQLSYLRGKVNQENDKGLIGMIDAVSRKIATLAELKSSDNKALTRTMCALYFCDIRARDPATFVKTCKIDLDPDMSKTKYLYELNPLCDNPTKPADKSLQELCTEAAFPANYQNVEAFAKDKVFAEINACMNAHFDRKLLDSVKEGSTT